MKAQVLKAHLIVFISSFCSLVIELVAGRILAPYVGVSLYTWTSIIGVVLAGISVGNYLGGRLADKRPAPSTLGELLLASSVLTLAVAPLIEVINRMPLPYIPRILMFAFGLFFLPSLLMGMVSPVVIKLTLGNLSETGNVVGRIYAFSTLGSIVGNFVTGFWLISVFGTRAILFGVAGVLFVSAVVFGELWRLRGKRTDAAATTVVLLGMVGLLGLAYLGLNKVAPWNIFNEAYAAPCQVETNYYCIRVEEQPSGNGTVKTLILDHLIHSYVDLDDPTYLQYEYESVYSELTGFYMQPKSAPPAVLFIGGGGYTFPRYVEKIYQGSQVDVVEIDPGVTAMVHQKLGLPLDTTIRTFNMDARIYFKDMAPAGKYDFVYGDAFNDLSVPYHLTTVEFDREIKRALSPSGVYMANVIDMKSEGTFLQAFATSLMEVFPHVYVVADHGSWQSNGSSTWVVMGANQPLNREAFDAFLQQTRPNKRVSQPVPDDELKAYVQRGGQKILLTDDHAPVDNMVAPLFTYRFG